MTDPQTPRHWNCETHGPGNINAWGCPKCVAEMRDEISSLNSCIGVQHVQLERLQSNFDCAAEEIKRLRAQLQQSALDALSLHGENEALSGQLEALRKDAHPR